MAVERRADDAELNAQVSDNGAAFSRRDRSEEIFDGAPYLLYLTI